MEQDRYYMMHALALAKRGVGKTSPNPMVGCIIVKDGAIIGEGWHAAVGQPHAEARALAAAGTRARGATAYVTLEPCNHHGRTPSCTEALLAAGVAEVVYALTDPNPVAAGGGASLREHSIRVRSNVCKEEAEKLNRFWLHTIKHNRPYIIAKFAMSLDGKIATTTGDSKWITGTEARARSHALRRRIDAIVVGADTVITDNPSLTAREGRKVIAEPLRIILDSTGRTPPEAAVYCGTTGRAIIATTKRASHTRLEHYSARGVKILILEAEYTGRPDISKLLGALKGHGVCSVIVEGGAQVLGSFFDAGLVDEVWAFIAPLIIGGEGKSPIAGKGAVMLHDALSLKEIQTEHLGHDFLVRGCVDRAEDIPCSLA